MSEIPDDYGDLFLPGEVELLKNLQIDPKYVHGLLRDFPVESVRLYIDALLDKPGHGIENVAGPARDDTVGNSY